MPSRSTGISDHHIRIHHDTHKYRRRRCADKLGDRCFLACGIPVVMCCSLFLLGTLGASAFFLPLGSVQHHSQAADWLIKLQSHSGRGPPFRRRGTGGCTSGDRGGQLRLSAAPAEVVERPRLMDMAWPTLTARDAPRRDRAGDLSGMWGMAAAKGVQESAEQSVDQSPSGDGGEGRGPTGGFEGPEKTLEIEFDPAVGHKQGLRAVRREQWDAILEQAQCQILHHRGNECFDSYVLSESSLFVYNHKLVLKTCGTTTLLRCLPLLTVVTKSYGLNLEWIGYSRKDFTFPTDQIYPHASFAQEVDFLQTMFTGSAYVHGPLNSDHWYTYVADDGKRPDSAVADRTLNLMMYDLEPEVARNFYKSDEIQTAADVSLRSGIKGVLPMATLQDHLFEPCGYSMNALEGRAYYTIHVTPEPDFSYASFETNVRLPDYNDVVREVLEVFRPRKFTMTLFAEKTGMEDIKENPFNVAVIRCAPKNDSRCGGIASYSRMLTTTTNFAGDYLSQMGNWVRESQNTLLPSHEVQSAAA